ncbi:hypothetical protein BGW38_008193 [Lunasporangiospora selenospora]|uniref:F-box domain-containing protein n=1 Tax=Lunasporangiospora selenospora TaxID=979761 RepID=A0A9P6FYQ9_9FUNG|nr:hypothetical protein BGW38_008193 [Lunasporangiospora selenospora]
MDSIRDQRNQPSQPTSKYAREHPLVPESCVFAATFVALPSTLPEPAAPLLPFKSENAMSKALSIAEIVLLIQKQLDRPSLLASLQVNRSWNVIGQHLVWESVLWENTLEDEVQNKMVEHLGRIRELRCSFNAQADSSPCRLNSSKLLRLVLGYHQGLAVSHSRDHSSIGPETGKDSEWHQFSPPPHSLSCNTPSSVRRPLQHSSVLHKGQGVDSPIIAAQTPTTSKLRLRRLHLEGYFDLQQTLNNSNINAIHEYRHLIGSGPRLTRGLATLVSFSIPSLTRLVISPAVDIAVDIHLVLDSAIGLEYLTIRSHGSFVDSTIPARLLDQYDQEQEPIEEAIEYRPRSYPAHWTLKSLKIQHLKISQEDLEQVMARCPNLIEFYSLSSPGALWRQRAVHGAAGLLPPLVIPPTDNLTQQHTHPSLQSLSIPLSASQLSLVGSIARSCPKIEKFHVGLQHGGLHLDSIREIMSLFPRLDSLGIPAWDCSKAAMESIKQAQTKAVGSTSATLARPAWSLRSLHHPSAQAPPTTTTATVLRLGHEQGRTTTTAAAAAAAATARR